MLCSVSTKKTTRPQAHEIVDLDVEETRVAKLLAHRAVARASSSPENRNTIRQSPRLSAKPNRSAGSYMRSGCQPSKLKLTVVDAVAAASTPEETKARARVEAGKRRNKKKCPEEGKAGKQDDFMLRPTYYAIT